MQARLRGKRQSQRPLNHEKFFQDALMYWEMLATFVEPVPKMTFAGFGAPIPNVSTEEEPRLPHPWAGLNTELHFVLAEIGRILRGRQSRLACAYHGRRHTDDRCEHEEHWAGSLETFLCSIQIPNEENIIDYGDENTPKSDLIRTAHAHRYVCLLELYCAFPRLLEGRIGGTEKFPPSHYQEFEAPTDHSSYRNVLHSWLFAIAAHILEMLKAVSISSAACRLQPLALVSCAGQLRMPDNDLQNAFQEKVVDMRWTIEARLLSFSRKYPEKPLLQMLDIVKEVWQRLDDGAGDAHWLAVAHEKGWQTMMG